MSKCIIVGNGPSIKNIPLEKLSYPSFGVNRLKPGFEPTYYVNLRREHSFRKDAGRADYQWDVDTIKDGVARCKKRSFIWRGNILWGLGDDRTTYMETERIKMWSDNPDHVFTFGGQTCCATQVAVMLGFTEIIMIGMDGDYKPWEEKDINHYSRDYLDGYIEYMTKEKTDFINKTIAEMHLFIEEECKQRGVKVTNVNTRNYIVEER